MIDIDSTKAYGQLKFQISALNIINGQVSERVHLVKAEIENLVKQDKEEGATIQRQLIREQLQALLEDKVFIHTSSPHTLAIRKEIAKTGNTFELVLAKDPTTGVLTKATGHITEPGVVVELDFDFKQ